MTIHYHGTPITPVAALHELTGRSFCVSHAAPQDIERVHAIGEGVMLDNGAFRAWMSGGTTDWPAYYAWTDRWLDYSTTWAVIPDVIDGSEEMQDALLAQWPHGHRGSPVWHMNEGIHRLLRLLDTYPRVCIGSTKQYAVVMSPAWHGRMEDIWDAIVLRHQRTPDVHMLRGMKCAEGPYPFTRLDSTDIARNHNRPQNTPRKMADRWDAKQCQPTWRIRARQLELIA